MPGAPTTRKRRPFLSMAGARPHPWAQAHSRDEHPSCPREFAWSRDVSQGDLDLHPHSLALPPSPGRGEGGSSYVSILWNSASGFPGPSPPTALASLWSFTGLSVAGSW